MTPSAAKVLRALRPGEATFDELMVRVRPMSESGMLRAMHDLDSLGLVTLREGGESDGYAGLTDAGREAAERLVNHVRRGTGTRDRDR